ncbi:AraC family transcriptional regulator [Maribacter sp. 1_MG-2023]|uniref:helix-turn-helix domain-containing protein n=1 Tax=Maribacter sp. 1_MG-2023 TaxID=3062677 RepID=UPI0026E4063A|nr:helix-turn-helix transcriptional regulator [Maribacter sp. 1_MG-2023]MDO6470376.1 helix-turn-helix transcriptional regulator [Maribacter sp. 1_MG-2023]
MIQVLQSLRLTLLNVGYAKLNTSWNFENVISPFTRMYYITKGSAKVYHNNQIFTLKPGYMYLIPSYCYAKFSCDNYHEQFYISFLEEVNNGISIYGIKDFNYEIEADKNDKKYFERLLSLNSNREIMNSDPKTYDNKPTLQDFIKQNEVLSTKDFLETQGLLTVLFSKFITSFNVQNKIQVANYGMQNILNYINNNLQSPITVVELAEICNYSPDHFSKLFKQAYKSNPNKFIQEKRIERSQLLLLTTNDSLNEIAEKVGLNNISYFSRLFKKHTGKTPAFFRKEQVNI